MVNGSSVITANREGFVKYLSCYPWFTYDQAVEMWRRGLRLQKFQDMMDNINERCMKNPEFMTDPKLFVLRCFYDAGYLSSVDGAPSERRGVVMAVRCGLAYGVSKEIFMPLITTFGISDEELY